MRLRVLGWVILAAAGISLLSKAVERLTVPGRPTPVARPAGPITRPIEQLRVGDRVLAENPQLSALDPRDADPEPGTWRRVVLALTADDGHRVDVELLRPTDWVAEVRAEPGRMVWLSVDEMGVEGDAEVLAVGPCPPIAAGAGRVVTGTFRHEAAELVEVRIAGCDPVRCTGSHPFWSGDRQDFVRADTLRAGERLWTVGGRTAVVERVDPRAGTEPVFNLEVDYEHVYFIGTSGVLVHNGCEQERDDKGKFKKKDGTAGVPGSLHANRVIRWVENKSTKVQTEVTIRPRNADGTYANYRVRVDAMATSKGGKIELYDAKASATAGKTTNQRKGYDLIEKYGGKVEGAKGGIDYPAGTVVPPTKPEIVRPTDLPPGF